MKPMTPDYRCCAGTVIARTSAAISDTLWPISSTGDLRLSSPVRTVADALCKTNRARLWRPTGSAKVTIDALKRSVQVSD